MVTHEKGTAELICELEDVTSPTKGDTMKEHVFVSRRDKICIFWTKTNDYAPSVVYYWSNEGKLVQEFHVFISDDIKHDHHAANLFLQRSIEDIKTHLPEIYRIVIFTYGCSSQYKSKCPLVNLSRLAIPTDFSYFLEVNMVSLSPLGRQEL